MQYDQTSRAKKARYPDRRNHNRTPRKKIARRVKRRKKRNAQPAISHGIEYAVARRRKKKVCIQCGRRDLLSRNSNTSQQRQRGQYHRKNKRMRESSVSPKIFVANTEMKSHNIDIRKHRARDPKQPKALRQPRLVERSSDADRRHRVRDHGRQRFSPVPYFFFSCFTRIAPPAPISYTKCAVTTVSGLGGLCCSTCSTSVSSGTSLSA